MKVNNFDEMIELYETNCQNTATQEYVDILYNLSFVVACAVLNTTISKTGNRQLQDLKTKLYRDYNNIRYINSDSITDDGIEHLIRIPLEDGMDLVHTASATIIDQTKQNGNAIGFMQSPYKERRLKKKVWIKKDDSINGWETVETTPIQETYRAVRREIEHSRAISTDAQNGYSYLEDIAHDNETGEETRVYKRLTKYADLGGYAMASPYDNVENIVLNHSMGRQGELYSVDNSMVQNIDQILELLKLTARQSEILGLRMSGYGCVAIGTYLGVREESVRRVLQTIQNKAVEKLELPDYLVKALTEPRPQAAKNKLTDDDKDNMRKLYKDGHSMKFIADRFNVSKMTVSRVIKGRKDRK